MASKTISKSVVWQLIGKFALQGIAFFTTPIFTRLLSPSDYGYTSLYMSWSSILCLFIGLQTYGSIQNSLIKFEGDERDRYFSSIMSISVLSFVFCLFGAFVLNSWLSSILSIRQDLVILVVIQSFGTYIITFYTEKYNALKQVEKSAVISICQTIFCVGLSLFFVLLTNDNKAIAKIYGNAIPVIIISIVLIIKIYAKGKCVWNSQYNKFCLTLTLPLIFHGVGNLVFSQTDRIMLQKMIDEETLGIYSVSFALCSILTIIYGALNTAWLPFYYDWKKNKQKNEIAIHSKRYIKFFALITIGFILLAYDVFKIMAPPEYNSGMRVIPFFVCAHFFNFLYLFPVNFEFFHEKTKLIPIGTLGAAVINLVVNFLLIPNCGILGAAIGTLVAHLALFVFHEFIACFVMKQDYEYRRFFPLFTWAIIIILICSLFYLFDFVWYLRWSVALIIGVYIVIDTFKHRSFF
jgi:O-antigen/teichoic acid export membrane protein